MMCSDLGVSIGVLFITFSFLTGLVFGVLFCLTREEAGK